MRKKYIWKIMLEKMLMHILLLMEKAYIVIRMKRIHDRCNDIWDVCSFTRRVLPFVAESERVKGLSYCWSL